MLTNISTDNTSNFVFYTIVSNCTAGEEVGNPSAKQPCGGCFESTHTEAAPCACVEYIIFSLHPSDTTLPKGCGGLSKWYDEDGSSLASRYM